jgi:hypothetical protein
LRILFVANRGNGDRKEIHECSSDLLPGLPERDERVALPTTPVFGGVVTRREWKIDQDTVVIELGPIQEA